MGSYNEYLQSAHWVNKKKEFIDFWESGCSLCSSPNELHVHHRTYKNKWNEKINDCVVLCKTCHEKFHNVIVEPFNEVEQGGVGTEEWIKTASMKQIEGWIKSMNIDCCEEERNRRQEMGYQEAKRRGCRIVSFGIVIDEGRKKTNEPEISVAETKLVESLFENEPRIVKFIFENLKPSDFEGKFNNSLAELVYNVHTNGGDLRPGALIDKIENEDTKKFALNIAFENHSVSKSWDEINPGVPVSASMLRLAKDNIKCLRLFRIDKQLEEKHELIERKMEGKHHHVDKQCEEEIIKLFTEKNRLQAERRQIEKESMS